MMDSCLHELEVQEFSFSSFEYCLCEFLELISAFSLILLFLIIMLYSLQPCIAIELKEKGLSLIDCKFEQNAVK